ncbi:MAG TPA: GNAT family N-acetyltransferase [Hyalangium sp.]|nr:GNAT family N-acetyltransferase [Hyalangium sp.]
MRLRPAEPSDVEALVDIHVSSSREAMPWLPQLHTREQTVWWMRHHVLVRLRVWVAEEEGQVVGYAALGPGELEQLYVRPGYQGRGVGRRLLAQAKALEPQGLELWVFQRNTRARTFYEAHGFQPVSFTDGSRNEEREPDARYTWKPAP